MHLKTNKGWGVFSHDVFLYLQELCWIGGLPGVRWHVSGSLFLPKRRLEWQLGCSADCKKKTYWFDCDRQSVRPIIFHVFYKWALISFIAERHEMLSLQSWVVMLVSILICCAFIPHFQTSGKKNNNNFPWKNEKVTTPASFFKAPCSLDDSQLFLTDAKETVSYSWWQAQMSWDGSKSSPSSDPHKCLLPIPQRELCPGCISH